LNFLENLTGLLININDGTVFTNNTGHNLVPRGCDPREGTRGSGIIRFREESDWLLKWMRSSILARIPGFRQRIIPEPRVSSRGSQARGTRLYWPSQTRGLYQPRSQGFRVRTRGDTRNPWSGPVNFAF
jgi:hypothetical protein